MAAKKRKRRLGKGTYFPRVKRLLLSYPAGDGGTIEIVKDKHGEHRVIADDAVVIEEIRLTKKPPG